MSATNLRPVAALIDRFAVPISVYLSCAAALPYIGVPIGSIWRDLAPAIAAAGVACTLAASPIGGLGFRLTGLQLVHDDGAPVRRSLRCLIELGWLFLTFGPVPLVPMIANALLVSITGRSFGDRVFRTTVARDPTVPDAPPTLIPDTVTEAGGLRVASGIQRVASTAIDVAAATAAILAGYLLPLVFGYGMSGGGEKAMFTALLGGLAGVIVAGILYALTHLVLLFGWSTSVGKRLLGLRVVSLAGGRASFTGRLLRVVLPPLVFLVPFAPFVTFVMLGVAYVTGRLPFHDRWSRTTVVRVR